MFSVVSSSTSGTDKILFKRYSLLIGAPTSTSATLPATSTIRCRPCWAWLQQNQNLPISHCSSRRMWILPRTPIHHRLSLRLWRNQIVLSPPVQCPTYTKGLADVSSSISVVVYTAPGQLSVLVGPHLGMVYGGVSSCNDNDQYSKGMPPRLCGDNGSCNGVDGWMRDRAVNVHQAYT